MLPQAGGFAILERMKPTAPDTELFRFASSVPLDDIEAELEAAQRMVVAAQTYMEWLRITKQMAATLEASGLHPTASKRKNGKSSKQVTLPLDGIAGREKPTLRNAILLILGEQPRKWSKKELLAELRSRGWLPGGQTPDKQLTNRLTEMKRRGEVVRHEAGVYSAAHIEDPGKPPSQGDGDAR